MSFLTAAELKFITARRTDKSFTAAEKKELWRIYDKALAELSRLEAEVARFAADAVTDDQRIATLTAERDALAAKLAVVGAPSVPAPLPTPPTQPALAAITIKPNPAEAKPGDAIQFVASGWLAGADVPHITPVTWSATGGTIDAKTGRFVAGSVAGAYTVTARSTLSGHEFRKGEGTVSIVAILAGGGAGQPPIDPSGMPTPEGGDTILFDTRAGGAESFQDKTDIAGIEDVYDDTRYTGGATASFETNVDGSGTNALLITWDSVGSTEEEAFHRKAMSAPATGWYTRWKMKLSSDFLLGGHGNAHQKMVLWLRDDLDGEGRSQSRIYLVLRPGEDLKFSIDGFNYNSSQVGYNFFDHVNEIVDICVYIQPESGAAAGDGILRVWIDDVFYSVGSAETIGHTGLTSIEHTVTTFPGTNGQQQWWWDMVVWVPA